MTTPRLGAIVINATDHDGLVAFWSELLDVGVARQVPGYFTWLEPQESAGSVSVAVQRVDAPTEGRRRLHMDFGVDDVDAAVARVVELGGEHLEDQQVPGFAWKVMADPEGNEFCMAAVPG
ncbi:VOC family protein [soil metagenome]